METNIIALEKKYWQGMEDRDFQTVKDLTRFPCLIAGKNGVKSVDEENFKRMFESGGQGRIKVLGFTSLEAQTISENIALIAYTIEFGMGDQHQTLKCACTSTWVKENEDWRCALHTETELAV